MQAPQNNHQNLYEIPNCTICLGELAQQLVNLNCGHVFHTPCILQHFRYKGTCPNCQKRAHQKQMRPIVFQLQKNTQAAQLMRNILGTLSAQQKQQVQVLFKEVQVSAQKNQKLENKFNQAEKQLKKATTQLNETKTSFNRVKVQFQAMKKQNKDLRTVIDHHQTLKSKLDQQNFQLRTTIQGYKQKQAQYEQLRRYKKAMNDNSQKIINYKNELQSKGTPAQQTSKQFFEMLLIKNLECVKLKNKLQENPQKIALKDQQIKKLKSTIEKDKAQIKDLKEHRAQQKKKYEDLKVKHRNLIDKYKAKCQQLSDEENYQDSMFSRPSFPLVNTSVVSRDNNNMSLNNSKDQNSQSNIPFAQTKINKKPSSSLFDSIIEQEPSSSLNKQSPKKPVQQSLNSFFPQKNAQTSFGTYGGMQQKKKADDKKPPIRNLFS